MRIAQSRSTILCVILLTGLAGCGVPQRLGFGRATPEIELPFRSKLGRGDEERQFVVRVEANGAGVDAVRESVRHPATGFCLLEHGGSDIAWDLDATGDWRAARDADGDLTFAGTCTAR